MSSTTHTPASDTQTTEFDRSRLSPKARKRWIKEVRQRVTDQWKWGKVLKRLVPEIEDAVDNWGEEVVCRLKGENVRVDIWEHPETLELWVEVCEGSLLGYYHAFKFLTRYFGNDVLFVTGELEYLLDLWEAEAAKKREEPPWTPPRTDPCPMWTPPCSPGMLPMVFNLTVEDLVGEDEDLPPDELPDTAKDTDDGDTRLPDRKAETTSGEGL